MSAPSPNRRPWSHARTGTGAGDTLRSRLLGLFGASDRRACNPVPCGHIPNEASPGVTWRVPGDDLGSLCQPPCSFLGGRHTVPPSAPCRSCGRGLGRDTAHPPRFLSLLSLLVLGQRSHSASFLDTTTPARPRLIHAPRHTETPSTDISQKDQRSVFFEQGMGLSGKYTLTLNLLSGNGVGLSHPLTISFDSSPCVTGYWARHRPSR